MITKRMRRSLFVAAAAAAFAAAAAAQTEWNSGTITYDGAANITAMGQDVYVYDSVGRLVSGTANQQQSGVTARQDYSYDAFGNRLNVTTTGTACVGRCAPSISVSTVTNRISGNNATYDSIGHMKSFGAESYTYDGAEMVSRVTDGTIDWQFVYTADDERLATYTGQGNWRFTVRDVDKTVLREVTAYQGQSGTTWTWERDHVYRDGLLLATLYPSGQRQQFHLDHLGSPRVVTDVNGARIGLHAYYPFGDELALNGSEWLPERMKFTGHERDTLGSDEPLDYMHGRDYSPTAGRFLSLDRITGAPNHPQTWNRYVYGLNNPMKLVDRDGNYFEWAPGLSNADRKFIRDALVQFIRRPGGWQDFYKAAMDPKRIFLAVGTLNTDKALSNAHSAILRHGALPSIIRFGATDQPVTSRYHDWTITFDRDAHKQFAAFTSGKVDSMGVITSGHEFFHLLRAFLGDWAAYNDEKAAGAHGEEIYGERTWTDTKTANALFDAFFDPSAWNLYGEMFTLYNSDSFTVEGITISFAEAYPHQRGHH
jgi:RHS repeat-associated protein